MRKLFLILAFMISIVCLAANAHAARNISLPYSTDFTTNDISDLVWTRNGGTVTYSTNGWSGGAVKITPPTSVDGSGNGSYSAIGRFENYSTSRINIRFLMKIGPTYVASHRGYTQNKFIDVFGTSSGTSVRMGIFTLEKSSGFYAPGVYPRPSNWTVFRSPGTADSDHDQNNSPFKIYDDGTYSNVWICYEYEINVPEQTARVVITQSDGTTTEIATPSSPGGLVTDFYIGGYHNGYSVADDGNWLLIDNLAISGTGYIGPPSGFVGGGHGGGTEIMPPEGLRVDISQ